MKHAYPALILVLFAAPAFSGGLDRDLVPASTRWIAHLDVEHFLRTELFQAAREHGAEDVLELDEMRDELGLDPLEDLLSITVFAFGDRPEEAVALLALRAEAAQRALDRAEEEEDHVFLEVDGVRLRGWTKDDRIEVYAYDAKRGDEHFFLLCDDRSRLLDAVSVFAGDSESLADADEAHIAARPAPGSFFYAEASEGLAGLHDLVPVSTVNDMVRGMRFDASEEEGVLELSLSLDLRDGEDAEDVAQVLQGGVALAELFARCQAPGTPGLELVDSLTFRNDDTRLVAEFSHASRALIEVLQELDPDRY